MILGEQEFCLSFFQLENTSAEKGNASETEVLLSELYKEVLLSESAFMTGI